MVARPLRWMWRHTDHPVIERWTGPIDLVFGPNFVVPPARDATEVVTVHDLTCVRFPEMCTADTLQLPGLLRRSITRGAWVHTVSQTVAADVIDVFGADPERVVAIPNGAPPRRDIASIELLASAGRRLAGTDEYLAFVGTLEPRKDLPTLVRAFGLVADAHPDLHLVIAGPDGWGAAAVHESIGRSRHADRIRCTGWLSDTDRDAVVAGAAAFVYPSRFEGFGLPPLEAMGLDTPVVATRVGALPEVLGDAALWATPDDVDDLARAITEVIDDPDIRARLVASGHERLSRYSWDRTADELLALFARATGAPSGA
jgi:glycosyltransferase involved in cell wall biosynthesis